MPIERTATGLVELAFVCLISSIAFLQKSSLNAISEESKQPSQIAVERQERRTQLNLALLQQLPDFGFDNLVADWVYLSFLQYFGDEPAREIGGYRLSPEFFEIIVDRNPLFFEAYIYLTNSTTIYAGQPQRSVDLMEKGLQAMMPGVPPKAYAVWRYKGTDELLFLGNSEAAQQSFRQAADWADQASGTDAELVARLSRQTANFLAADPNSRTAQINAWMQVFLRAVDDTVRQEAVERIESLGGKILLAENGQITVRYTPEP